MFSLRPDTKLAPSNVPNETPIWNWPVDCSSISTSTSTVSSLIFISFTDDFLKIPKFLKFLLDLAIKLLLIASPSAKVISLLITFSKVLVFPAMLISLTYLGFIFLILNNMSTFESRIFSNTIISKKTNPSVNK